MPFAAALAGRIGLVHLRDQQGEKPVPFWEGELPFAELFKLLADSGYDGPLVVELALTNCRRLRQNARLRLRGPKQ